MGRRNRTRSQMKFLLTRYLDDKFVLSGLCSTHPCICFNGLNPVHVS